MIPNIPAVPSKGTPKVSLKIATTVPTRTIPIEYIGEGAERVKYTPGPKVTSARIYSDGFIVETF